MKFFKGLLLTNSRTVRSLPPPHSTSSIFLSNKVRFFSSLPGYASQSFDPQYRFSDLQLLPDRRKYEKAVFKRLIIGERESFKRKTCVLTISLSQNNTAQTSHKFAATAELVDRSFKECKIILGDSLQRLTARIFIKNSHLTDEELMQKSLELGRRWQAENSETLLRFSIPVSIHRWLEFTRSDSHKKSVNVIRQHIKNNDVFRQTFEKSSENFLLRLSGRGDEIIDYEIAKRYCMEYLVEECAALCQWHKLGPENEIVEIYAYGRNEAMDMMNKMLIEPVGLSFPCYPLYFKRVSTKEGLDVMPHHTPCQRNSVSQK